MIPAYPEQQQAPAQAQESIYRLVQQGSRPDVGQRVQPIPVSSRPVKPFVPGKLSSHQNSSQLQSIFNPIQGFRDSQRRCGPVVAILSKLYAYSLLSGAAFDCRQGLTPTDHARLNRQAIKQMSIQNKAVKQLETHAKAQQQIVPSRPAVKTPVSSR